MIEITMLKRYFALVISTATLAITASTASANPILTTPPRQLIRPVKCVASFVKEFTQVPAIVNESQETIPAGTTINWRAYWAGQPTNQIGKLVLSQPLLPGKSISTQVKLSGDNNSCTAYY